MIVNQYMIYECETCGKHSEDREEIEKCEAAHLGLTITEKQKWNVLKRHVEHMNLVVKVAQNEKAKKAYDEACAELINFEKEHNLKMTEEM